MFHLYIEHGSASEAPTHVLSARRRKKAATPHYVIAVASEHATEADLKRSVSSTIIASVLGNRQGTAYRCVASPRAAAALAAATPNLALPRPSAAQAARDGGGVEIGAVRFKQAPASKVCGVRQFVAVLPGATPTASPAARGAKLAAGASLLDRMDAADAAGAGAARTGLFTARSLRPEYDEARKMYTMNFDSRVAIGSPKNCQLVAQEASGGNAGEDAKLEQTLFLFGKVAQDCYSMDFAAPLCLLQAFGIAVACFDTRSFSG